MRQKIILGILLAGFLTILSGCDSAEERAEKHFQIALTHIENGDFQRAKVEFKNVFKLNGKHREARETYARILREQGAVQEAYSQYLRLVEQYPDDLEGQRALAEMSISTRNWDEAERHGKVALELAPQDPLVKSIGAMLAFRKASIAKDLAAQKQALANASALVLENPKLIIAHRMIINDLIGKQNWDDALTAIDIALQNVPDAKDLYSLRIGVLNQMGRTDKIEAQLKEMIARFPNEQKIQAALVKLYIEQGNLDAAEAFLRARVAATDDKAEAISVLIQFLVTNRDPEIAKSELVSVIKSNPPKKRLFQSLLATLEFDSGKHEAAIVEMENIIKGADESADLDNIKITLAHMLIKTNNNVGARALIEEVLEHDNTHVDALKLKAGWLIEDDDTGGAILALRTALGQSPRDPEIMTLMAWAHERDGNKELMGEMLALATEASGSAPEETLRYAKFLIKDAKMLPAEDVLLKALRLKPQNTDLLNALGELYISMKDWGRSDQIIRTLEKINSPVAKGLADDLTIRKLNLQQRFDELSTFLGNMSKERGEGANADLAIIRAHLLRGDTEAALAFADGLLAKKPDDPQLRLLRALVLISGGNFNDAEQSLSEMLSEDSQNEQAWLILYRLYRHKNDQKTANLVLEKARKALPNSPNFKWIAAGELEKSGDIESAISLYEELYASNSNSVILANNLASLLSTRYDDPESLRRAQVIARRLRNSKLPQFQDTYGWISFRLGNAEDALKYLESAAQGLPGDVTVQFHLAMTYAALNRNAEALAQYNKTFAAIDHENPPAFAEKITLEIKRLEQINGQVNENN